MVESNVQDESNTQRVDQIVVDLCKQAFNTYFGETYYLDSYSSFIETYYNQESFKYPEPSLYTVSFFLSTIIAEYYIRDTSNFITSMMDEFTGTSVLINGITIGDFILDGDTFGFGYMESSTKIPKTISMANLSEDEQSDLLNSVNTSIGSLSDDQKEFIRYLLIGINMFNPIAVSLTYLEMLLRQGKIQITEPYTNMRPMRKSTKQMLL